ncbi:hypothetical protein [Streptomyces tendae]|uniref:hypothetical protein n=1 Tax=Streptomyces tendae TaxID=1932 RepID=UPI003D704673
MGQHCEVARCQVQGLERRRYGQALGAPYESWHEQQQGAENRLTGNEPTLVAALADAVVEVYGEGAHGKLFDRPDADLTTACLGAALTDAITQVCGDDLRAGIMVELVASPSERTFVGGTLTV